MAAVRVATHQLAVDQARAELERFTASITSGKRSDQSLPRRVISRMPTVAARHQPVAVVLDLVNPVDPDGGRSAGDGRQGSMKRRTGIAARI